MELTRQKQLIQSGGFSLVELMIAMVVLVGGMVAILGGIVSMNAQQRYADQEAITSNYINYLLEDLQESAPDSLSEVLNYSLSPDPFGNTHDLFVDADSPVTFLLPGLGYVEVRFIQGAAGPSADTVEIQAFMAIINPRADREFYPNYFASKMIQYRDEPL